ncbi:LAMI_0F10572g1_1 [Lachancea mirantina]|uniref:LAMI_0F10572g1_1 n=1 Tax=Lachancea mirantina TaxID=1230905 RepID=A0A1G4K1X1_9SACH|nr:LAMI_0F10572g1_1 [Lachancea mirantina]
MDSELQAIREARLAELKKHSGQDPGSATQRPAGESVAAFLEPLALERLSRVSLVRPDRARAVESYLQQMASRGQISQKITEADVVQILNGIARDEKKKNDTKIIFDRRETVADSTTIDPPDSEDDDFFD